MAVLLEQHPLHPHLLERLMETVRPEFRAETFRPPRDSPVFFTGVCVVPDCPIMLSHASRGLCEGHSPRTRWG
jgi:hypothetical protein